jgi:hypothetical protein
MTGVVLYDDLSKLILSQTPYQLPAYIESVRIKLDEQETGRTLWGKVTENAIKKAETILPECRRIFCMAIGAEAINNGTPTSWSAAIDQLCYNKQIPRIIAISAGNISVKNIRPDEYPIRNLITELDDPAQARNAITVGAMCWCNDRIRSISKFFS